jgi:hypothetical protein
MTENSFEILQAMRDLAEQDLTQAHAAHEQHTDFEDKTARVGMAAMPSPLVAGFKDVRQHAMDFAMENAESACTFASKVSNAKTPKEILMLQTRFAQDRTQTFVKNTQDLYGLIGETVH